MTGAAPEAPPPSDTLERLPDDFWGSEPDDLAPTEVAAPPPTAEAPGATASGRRAEPPPEAEAPRPRSTGSGVATLQRLFPGRVLGIEPHAVDAGVEAGEDADAEDPGTDDPVDADADAGDDGTTDEPPGEGGLESDRSRR